MNIHGVLTALKLTVAMLIFGTGKLLGISVLWLSAFFQFAGTTTLYTGRGITATALFTGRGVGVLWRSLDESHLRWNILVMGTAITAGTMLFCIHAPDELQKAAFLWTAIWVPGFWSIAAIFAKRSAGSQDRDFNITVNFLFITSLAMGGIALHALPVQVFKDLVVEGLINGMASIGLGIFASFASVNGTHTE